MRRKTRKLFIHLNQDSIKRKLLMFSVLGGQPRCFVRERGRRGKRD